jgi:hypothetical protein
VLDYESNYLERLIFERKGEKVIFDLLDDDIRKENIM